MGKLKRTVTIEANDGIAMTAHELMVACSEVPGDAVPTFKFNWKGTVCSITFAVQVQPDA